MSLSIVIPCYNEESRHGVPFKCRLDVLYEYLVKNIDDFELVLVSDGSTDNTVKDMYEFQQGKSVVVKNYKKNRGKGNAIKIGVLSSTKDIVLIMDADLATDINCIHSFYSTMLQNRGIDSIIGIRRTTYNVNKRLILSRLSKFCMENVLKLPLEDTQCGFKFVRANIIKKFCNSYQTCFRWLFDAELLLFLKLNSYSIKSLYVDWVDVIDSRVKLISGTLSSFIELLRIRHNFKYYLEVDKIESNIR